MAIDIPSFISRWRVFGGAERANKDSFFIELCEVLAIAPPQPKSGDPEQTSMSSRPNVAETFRGVTAKSVSPLLDTLASLGVVVAYDAEGERGGGPRGRGEGESGSC